MEIYGKRRHQQSEMFQWRQDEKEIIAWIRLQPSVAQAIFHFQEDGFGRLPDKSPPQKLDIGEASYVREARGNAIVVFRRNNVLAHISGKTSAITMLQHSGLHPRSVEVLQKAVLLRATNVDAKCALASALILSGQPQEAVTILREAVRLSPQSALAYATLGQAYRLLGKFQEALGALQEALRISPEDPVSYNYLGMTYESLQLKQDALAAYKQAINLKSDYAQAHYNLALMYFTLGDRSQAQHHYEILKTISPDLAAGLLKKLRQ